MTHKTATRKAQTTAIPSGIAVVCALHCIPADSLSISVPSGGTGIDLDAFPFLM